jgi:hypothetical protein
MRKEYEIILKRPQSSGKTFGGAEMTKDKLLAIVTIYPLDIIYFYRSDGESLIILNMTTVPISSTINQMNSTVYFHQNIPDFLNQWYYDRNPRLLDGPDIITYMTMVQSGELDE